MSENKYICKSCGSQDVYYDEKYAEWTCKKCGAIAKMEHEIGEAVNIEEEEDLKEEDWFDYAEPEDLVDAGIIDESELYESKFEFEE
jgi:DNA-directed RNA polymerase subunit RPC12/RpoP